MKHVGNTDVDRTKVYNGIRLTIEPLAKKRKKLEIYSCALYHSLSVIREEICESICLYVS